MNLSKPISSAWDFLLILSVIGLAVAGAFAFVVPPPKAARTAKVVSAQEFESSAIKIGAEASAEQAKVLSRTWPLTAEVLGSELLDRLTTQAKGQSVQVNDFRSGRVVAAANLWEVNFTVVLEGAFPDVMRLIESLENPESKVAVSQCKLTTKSEADYITCTLMLTGFLPREEKAS